jgi:hypothetical protein
MHLLGYNTDSSAKVNRRFGGTYLLRLQCRRVSQARNWHDPGSGLSLAYTSILKMEAARQITVTVLYDVISQKIELFTKTIYTTIYLNKYDIYELFELIELSSSKFKREDVKHALRKNYPTLIT